MKSNQKIQGFYQDNKILILGAAGLVVLVKFWDSIMGLFGIVKAPLDALSSAAAAATASVKTSGQTAVDQNTIKTALPAPAPGAVQYKATAADIIRYRAVAEACAGALGTLKGQISNMLFTDDAALYAAIKPYGKTLLGQGGKALVKRVGNKDVLQLRALTGRYDVVIAPFYKELTGRSLQADLDGAFPASPGFASSADFKARCSFYRKYIRV